MAEFDMATVKSPGLRRMGNSARRIARLIELNAPDVIIANECLLLETGRKLWCEEIGRSPEATLADFSSPSEDAVED
jgi:hypothetical protein